MMKKMLFKAMALFIGMAMSVSLAACGDDNDDPEVPQMKIATVVVDYSMMLSEDYYDLWDIEISYTNPGGTLTTETVGEDRIYELNLLTADEIPTKYAFTVVAKPKTPAPALDPDKIYTLASECVLKISCLDAEGKEVKPAGMLAPDIKSVPTSGSHLEKAVTEQRTIFSKEFTVTLE